MEEFVGKIWHRWITRRADNYFPEEKATLEEMRQSVGVLFRALGGEGGLQIENTYASQHGARRGMLQKIAGTGALVDLAWRDTDSLRLPMEIAWFPEKSLNRDLYLWLAALASMPPAQDEGWFINNQRQASAVLRRFPGLRERYVRLVKAHIAQRNSPKRLSDQEAAVEKAVRAALMMPERLREKLPYARTPPQPVPLWLHPLPPISPDRSAPSSDTVDEDSPESSDSQRKDGGKKKRKAERVDDPDGKNGLMMFRLESMFTWAEYVKVDRTADDDDDGSIRTADDLDVISVAEGSQSLASRLKIDLDLPAAEYDDIVLGEGISLPEWDFRQQRLIPDHVRVQPMLARDAAAAELPPELRTQARKLRNLFEMLTPERQWFRGEKEGSELDIDAWITHATDRKLGHVSTEANIYRQLRNDSRDLSCLLLADLSLSTDTWINNEARVIDIIRDSLFLFSEALSATRDRFALYGFSSRHRDHVRFHILKNFAESYSPHVKGRIQAIKSGYYTRMGAAIRNASKILAEQPSAQKILLILTDGKPNDLDKYEGRYGVEDTRQAIIEAEKMGLQPFCVTIDEQAEEYLPYLFGARSFLLIKKAEELPKKLPMLYFRLTG